MITPEQEAIKQRVREQFEKLHRLCPPTKRDLAERRAIEALRAKGDVVLTLKDVLDAIRAEGLPPFKTRDRLLSIYGLKFIGKDRGDQRYKAER